MARRGSKGEPWWKDHEQLAYVAEQALRPLRQVKANALVRDYVNVLRQLDVAVIDSDRSKVLGIVEVQKRTKKVGIHDFGGFIHKRDTLRAKALVVVSEAGFTKSVLTHARAARPGTLRLAPMHEVDKGVVFPERGALTGLVEFADTTWVYGVFYQCVDNDAGYLDVDDPNRPIFANDKGPPASIMDILAHYEQTDPINAAKGGLNNVCLDFGDEGPLRWNGKWLRRLMFCYERRRRLIERDVRFFAYDEVVPAPGRRGILLTSYLNVQGRGVGTLTLVMTPVGTQEVQVHGQLIFAN